MADLRPAVTASLTVTSVAPAGEGIVAPSHCSDQVPALKLKDSQKASAAALPLVQPPVQPSQPRTSLQRLATFAVAKVSALVQCLSMRSSPSEQPPDAAGGEQHAPPALLQLSGRQKGFTRKGKRMASQALGPPSSPSTSEAASFLPASPSDSPPRSDLIRSASAPVTPPSSSRQGRPPLYPVRALSDELSIEPLLDLQRHAILACLRCYWDQQHQQLAEQYQQHGQQAEVLEQVQDRGISELADQQVQATLPDQPPAVDEAESDICEACGGQSAKACELAGCEVQPEPDITGGHMWESSGAQSDYDCEPAGCGLQMDPEIAEQLEALFAALFD